MLIKVKKMGRLRKSHLYGYIVFSLLSGCSWFSADEKENFTRAVALQDPPSKPSAPVITNKIPPSHVNPAAKEMKNKKPLNANQMMKKALEESARNVTECSFKGSRMVCPWFDGNIYEMFLKAREISTIDFALDEKIIHQKLTADEFFTVFPTFRGSKDDGTERDVLMIKAWLVGKRTLLTVLTDRREYQIHLITNAKLYNPSLQFSYPEVEAGQQPPERQIPRDSQTGIPIQYQNVIMDERGNKIPVHYTVKGDIGSLHGRDIDVITDGKRTYIKFPPGTGILPALFIKTKDGGDTPEYWPDGYGNYWVNGRIDKAVLQYGREMINIKRDK